MTHTGLSPQENGSSRDAQAVTKEVTFRKPIVEQAPVQPAVRLCHLGTQGFIGMKDHFDLSHGAQGRSSADRMMIGIQKDHGGWEHLESIVTFVALSSSLAGLHGGSPWGGVGWEEGSLEEGLHVSEGALVKSDQ